MPFDNSIKNMQTPGRLHALCKLVEYRSYSKDELRVLLQPEKLYPSSDAFTEVWRLADKGDLLHVDAQGQVSLNRWPSDADIADQVAFRQWIWTALQSGSDYVFNKFTQWFIQQGEAVLYDNAARLEAKFFDDISKKYTDKREYNATANIPAWLNWASYFGLGYAHSGVFIPSAAGRLKESMIRDAGLMRHKRMRMHELNDWLKSNCFELATAGSSHEFTYAVSLGLRALHDSEYIRLEQGADTTNAWYLTKNDLHPIPGLVTNFEIVGGATK